MRIKIIRTIETIWELPNSFYDDKDYDENNLSDCELASDFETGNKLWEKSEVHDISWNTREIANEY